MTDHIITESHPSPEVRAQRRRAQCVVITFMLASAFVSVGVIAAFLFGRLL